MDKELPKSKMTVKPGKLFVKLSKKANFPARNRSLEGHFPTIRA